ncbi:hypothetical protein AGRA3207_001264 [Actinomadura graeca]|uniref:Uncharacterized protein n=1 Tax=Actinomadura graeca TaxID=2750812 RepID=A0ABX8QPK7_9ACTN|nr:hypothetical protein [Actinomadura graeca]QXJ20535.1 hypothetical protein AGRA3207_001264 [Actinomadura graeca]
MGQFYTNLYRGVLTEAEADHVAAPPGGFVERASAGVLDARLFCARAPVAFDSSLRRTSTTVSSRSAVVM